MVYPFYLAVRRESIFEFMLGFEEEFEVALQMSEQEFSVYLLSIVDTDLDELSVPFANTIKLYRGHIKFNRFKLIPIHTFVNKAYGPIKGEFWYENGKLLISGRIVSNIFLLTFISGYSLVCFIILVYYLFISPKDKLIVEEMGVFFLIGVGNLIGIVRSLKRHKSNFLDRLKLAEKEEIPKS